MQAPRFDPSLPHCGVQSSGGSAAAKAAQDVAARLGRLNPNLTAAKVGLRSASGGSSTTGMAELEAFCPMDPGTASSRQLQPSDPWGKLPSQLRQRICAQLRVFHVTAGERGGSRREHARNHGRHHAGNEEQVAALGVPGQIAAVREGATIPGSCPWLACPQHGCNPSQHPIYCICSAFRAAACTCTLLFTVCRPSLLFVSASSHILASLIQQ